jgi:hypothetical protein
MLQMNHLLVPGPIFDQNQYLDPKEDGLLKNTRAFVSLNIFLNKDHRETGNICGNGFQFTTLFTTVPDTFQPEINWILLSHPTKGTTNGPNTFGL